MNTKGNQRFIGVQERIETALHQLLEEKPLEDITVSELCRRAKVHRTTFYGHYTDIYALVESIVGQMYTAVMEGFHRTETDWTRGGFLALFSYIEAHRAFFKSYVMLSRQYASGVCLLPQQLERHILELIRLTGTEREPLLYRYTFFTEGLKALLIRWIERDCAETPEEMYTLLADEFARIGLIKDRH